METETKTDTRPLPELMLADDWSAEDGRPVRLVVHLNANNSNAVALSPAELQHIVQLAYDEHGLLADPSYPAEADRVQA